MLSPRSDDSWLLWVVVMLWCCVCVGGAVAGTPQRDIDSHFLNRTSLIPEVISTIATHGSSYSLSKYLQSNTYVLHVLCTYLSRYIKLLSFPAPLTFSMQEIMCEEKHILWTRPRPPKSILHISTWLRREDLWLKVFEGNLLKMFPS